jgi:hypothetical protein
MDSLEQQQTSETMYFTPTNQPSPLFHAYSAHPGP